MNKQLDWIKGKKKTDKYTYCTEPIVLDIETSENHAENVEDIITWISSIQVIWLGEYYLFRTPMELMDWYNGLAETYDLEQRQAKIVTYIHNASYDLSYLIPFIKAYMPGKRSHSIKKGKHKYVKFTKGPFEFRCSYMLTNLSLDKWAKQMNTEHRKLIGFYDYTKVIYQDTELTEEELAYDREDVEVLYECIKKQMDLYNDTIITIPNTLSGYPRRDIRKSCLANKKYRQNIFLPQKLNYYTYRLCLKAFAGGYTHCNRFYRDTLLTCKIGHRDFKSHYPSIMKDEVFPMGKPKMYYDLELDYPRIMTIPEVTSLYPQYTAIATICIRDIGIRDKNISMPFLQESKLYTNSRDNNRPLAERMLKDNGRILSYKGLTDVPGYNNGRRYLEVDVLTLKILWEQYDFRDYMIISVTTFLNGKLPKEVLTVVDEYFKDKTEMKKLEHKLKDELGETDPETIEVMALTLRLKQLLNSIYGCIVTNPLNSAEEDELDEKGENKLERYYNSYYSVLAYQWGFMITAHARYRLYEVIKLVGYDNVLYCDTDSVFYIKTDEIEEKLYLYNQKLHKTASYVILKDGTKEYYSYLDSEPDCIAFKGSHSKCYGYVNYKNELKITIAGVPARTVIGMDGDNPIYLTREQELAGKEKDPIKALDHLSDDFVFTVNTGTTAIYIEDQPKEVEVDGHKVWTAGGCVVRKLKEKRLSTPVIDEYETDENPVYELYGQMIF